MNWDIHKVYLFTVKARTKVHNGLITVNYCYKSLNTVHLCEEIPGALMSCMFMVFFFVFSAEEKDGKTESKDENGEWVEGFSFSFWSFVFIEHVHIDILCVCAAAGSGAAASSGRNLWVSGLSSTTRATDLKTLFSKYGKVSLYNLSNHYHQGLNL